MLPADGDGTVPPLLPLPQVPDVVFPGLAPVLRDLLLPAVLAEMAELPPPPTHSGRLCAQQLGCLFRLVLSLPAARPCWPRRASPSPVHSPVRGSQAWVGAGLQPGCVFLVNSGVPSSGILRGCSDYGLEGLSKPRPLVPSRTFSWTRCSPCVHLSLSRGLAVLTVEVCGTFSLVLGHWATRHTQLPDVLSHGHCLGSGSPFQHVTWISHSGKTAPVYLSHPSRQLDWLIHPGVCQKVVLMGAVHHGSRPQHSPRSTQAFGDWSIMTMCSTQHWPGVLPAASAGWARQQSLQEE